MVYSLPKLMYEFNALEPYISEKQLRLHYEKHHKAYVDNANALIDKIEKARKSKEDLDFKSVLKSLSFNVGGHVLHSLFWDNMNPKPSKASNALLHAIDDEFGSFERFKSEFAQVAISVEGSGWAALAFDRSSCRLMLVQIEKHNVNLPPGFKLLLVLDVWEHAYYLDYENLRAKFVDAFWNVVNWGEVSRRYGEK